MEWRNKQSGWRWQSRKCQNTVDIVTNKNKTEYMWCKFPQTILWCVYNRKIGLLVLLEYHRSDVLLAFCISGLDGHKKIIDIITNLFLFVCVNILDRSSWCYHISHLSFYTRLPSFQWGHVIVFQGQRPQYKARRQWGDVTY